MKTLDPGATGIGIDLNDYAKVLNLLGKAGIDVEMIESEFNDRLYIEINKDDEENRIMFEFDENGRLQSIQPVY